MLSTLLNPNYNLKWMIFHSSLGLLCTYSKWFLIIWFYLFILLSINEIISDLYFYGRLDKLIFSFIYLVSFEVMGRMVGTYPYLPWELSKYLTLFVTLFLLLSAKVQKLNLSGFIILLLLIPSVLIDNSGLVELPDLINNLLGPICLGLLILVIGYHKINDIQFEMIIKSIWNTSILILVYTIILTPDYSEISFSLSALSETTGQFGSNQVATILGIGLFFSFYAWMNKLRFSGNHTLDGFFIALFAFQGFLSFSRGGMFIGVVSIFLYYLLFRSSKVFESVTQIRKLRPLLFFGLAIFFIFTSYFIIQNLSSGNLTQRYLGQTAGTLSGDKQRTFDTITTGRYSILKSDINLWNEYFIFGTGAGASKFMRSDGLYGKSPHTEFSRLLAEHGLFGLFIILILLYYLFNIFYFNKSNISRAILIVLFFIALGTSMHSSMRTFVTPIFLVLSTFNIFNYDQTNNY